MYLDQKVFVLIMFIFLSILCGCGAPAQETTIATPLPPEPTVDPRNPADYKCSEYQGTETHCPVSINPNSIPNEKGCLKSSYCCIEDQFLESYQMNLENPGNPLPFESLKCKCKNGDTPLLGEQCTGSEEQSAAARVNDFETIMDEARAVSVQSEPQYSEKQKHFEYVDRYAAQYNDNFDACINNNYCWVAYENGGDCHDRCTKIFHDKNWFYCCGYRRGGNGWLQEIDFEEGSINADDVRYCTTNICPTPFEPTT
ncbi:MAG: hypothetical protein KKF44_10215 [Nanoarchaeota archaeon]|nr:hypothetical protein [Nanoarchaeota archaeon]